MELGRNLVSTTGFSLSMEMSRLTRDGTAEPVSRGQIFRHEREQGNINFPVQLTTTSRIGNLTRLIHVCVFSSHSFWTSSSLYVPAGVTQEEGHTGFLHLLSAVHALIFLTRRIQPYSFPSSTVKSNFVH